MLSSLALAWLAGPQAEERRDWEADSACKPLVIAGNSSCRPKRVATWGRKCKAVQCLPIPCGQRKTPCPVHPSMKPTPTASDSHSWAAREFQGFSSEEISSERSDDGSCLRSASCFNFEACARRSQRTWKRSCSNVRFQSSKS